MYKVYRDWDGKNLLDEITAENKQTSSEAADNTDYNDDAYHNKIETLNKEVNQLRNEIFQVNTCISGIFSVDFIYS